MTPIEIIALIVIIAGIIKMIVLAVNPKSWMNFAEKVYSNPRFTSFIAFVLSLVVLNYLIKSGITIVQILAVTAFTALLIMIGIAGEIKPLLKKYETIIKRGKLWKEYWLYALIWIVILGWGLYEILM